MKRFKGVLMQMELTEEAQGRGAGIAKEHLSQLGVERIVAATLPLSFFFNEDDGQ